MRQKVIYYLKELILPIAMLMLLVLVACTSSPTSTLDATPKPTTEPVQEPTARPAPSELVPRITIEELLQKMESESNILVVDTRHKEQYDVDRIKGAVSAPLSTIVDGGWTPPSDKEIILYCS
ncbi:MAG: hypothetical protein JSV54_08880 [Chloroflexota bacterium]|nr:MAG: hypothetical protein JSV54_08880 [Chloroflexota bacterium]